MLMHSCFCDDTFDTSKMKQTQIVHGLEIRVISKGAKVMGAYIWSNVRKASPGKYGFTTRYRATVAGYLNLKSLISPSSQDSFQSHSLFLSGHQSPELNSWHQSTDSGKGGVSASPHLSHPRLQRPQRDSWDGPRGPSPLTLHRETLSFGSALQRYRWCPLSARYITLDAFYLALLRWEGSSSQCVCVCVYLRVCIRVCLDENDHVSLKA